MIDPSSGVPSSGKKVTCPDCKGTKEMHGMGCPGWKPITIPCLTCRGTGKVPKDMIDSWKPIGAAMKKNRLARDLSLREEAKRRRMAPGVLSQMERGVVTPIPDPSVTPTINR